MAPPHRPVGYADRSGVVRHMRGFGNELELYIGASSREQAMHRTDLTALAMVMDESAAGHQVTPTLLSQSLQLSAPATSAMLERLERLGHVRRRRHDSDRRSVVVEMTDQAWAVGGAMFAHLARHLVPVIEDYSEAELTLISGFLERATQATREARTTLATAQHGAPAATPGDS
jgi:DNA-binding MarR family transcriptional regulator